MSSGVKKKNKSLLLVYCSFWLLLPSTQDTSVQAKKLTPNFSSQAQRRAIDGKKSSCANQNLEALTTQLLRDLPSYANRANQRARRLSRATDAYSYMVVAGRPEFQPLPLNPSGLADSAKTVSEGVEQLFFTTLERQYTAGKAVQLQQFHWLFLTKTKSDWRLVMMYSQIGSFPKNQPPTPPRDSSNGVIAQGITAWLRDCQAGSVRVRSENSGN
ncbi:hypothetical protein [Brasilonema sp. UFV-L1]|uniref:hypothetical protein n=1 Tax=Brasilonema sp. UFV-L1 TaxID=2234130 RepID=UPI00145DC853|nr:hypothetical protein [Brasilonema sp. UFV-L1]NMG09715.1 hypothetical protein [Brasilonema sp. UFV-L1]